MSGVPFAGAFAATSIVLFLAAVVSVNRSPTLSGIEAVPRGVGRARATLGAIGRSRVGRRVARGRPPGLADSVGSRWDPDELAGAKVAAFLAAVATVVAAPPPLSVLALPIALLGWRGPELVLSRRARRRAAEASREVPLFLDLLGVATSAGLAPQLAVRVAAAPLRGPLAEELASAILRTELGGRWRDEIQAVSERLALADLRRAAAVLGRSEALGSSLADEVARLAADVRGERRARAAERARTAPVKMLFPLVFLILPAFLLLTVVPVLLSTVRSIG